MGQEEHNTTTYATTCTEHQVNHMTTCTRTSRMQATSHIPRLTEVKRASVLRDVRDSQTEPSPALLFWHSSHSIDWPLQLPASLAANFWSAARDLCVSPTSFLRLSTSTARSLCRASFVSIVAVKVAISSFAATSPVWLALRSSSSF